MTRVQKFTKRLENHPVVSRGIMFGVIIVALASFTEAFGKLRKTFWSPKQHYDFSGVINVRKGGQPLSPILAVLSLDVVGSTASGKYTNDAGDFGVVAGTTSSEGAVNLTLASGTVRGTCKLEGSLAPDGTFFKATYTCADGEEGEATLLRLQVSK